MVTFSAPHNKSTNVVSSMQKPQQEGEPVKLTPFLKFGPFDPDNYKAKDLPKALETEEKYAPVRVLPGEVISGVIKDFFPSDFGELMYLDNVFITNKDGKKDVDKVKVGLSVDLFNKVKVFSKKQPGDDIQIQYLGKFPSPVNPSRTLHKFNVK